MLELNNAIREAIKQDLKSAAATEVAEFINDAMALQQKYDALTKEHAALVREFTELQGTYHKQEKLCIGMKEREVSVEKRESAVRTQEMLLNKRDNDLELTVARAVLEEVRNSRAEVGRLVERVFGHPGVKVERFTSSNVNTPEGYSSDSRTETVTTTDIKE